MPNLGIFILAQSFAITLIRGRLLQILQYYFQIPAQNTQIRHFWSFFIFAPNFAIQQIR